MYKKLKISLISATLILSSLYIVNAEDLLLDGINHSLNKLGETITSVLPGEGWEIWAKKVRLTTKKTRQINIILYID